MSESEQMLTLRLRQSQCSVQSFQHFTGNVHVPSLLKPRVPNKSNLSELCDFFAAKSRYAALANR